MRREMYPMEQENHLPDEGAVEQLTVTLRCLLGLATAVIVVSAVLGCTHVPVRHTSRVHYGQPLEASSVASAAVLPTMESSKGSQIQGAHYLIGTDAMPRVPQTGPVYRGVIQTAPEDLLFVRWLVQAGDVVRAGDPLLLAKKDGQLTRLKVGGAGVIKSVSAVAHPGQVISKGSELAVLGHPPVAPLDIYARTALFALIAALGSAFFFAACSSVQMALAQTNISSDDVLDRIQDAELARQSAEISNNLSSGYRGLDMPMPMRTPMIYRPIPAAVPVVSGQAAAHSQVAATVRMPTAGSESSSNNNKLSAHGVQVATTGRRPMSLQPSPAPSPALFEVTQTILQHQEQQQHPYQPKQQQQQ
ncbi:unnamed protein product [Polarella glacialis]|uniref:Uncharacterized protein n=1 Tax=Polarella glacialis TaxID=89957 RepID=A0A813L2N0_POLGL|nr:unnamed protein product [Polarella glacialis]